MTYCVVVETLTIFYGLNYIIWMRTIAYNHIIYI